MPWPYRRGEIVRIDTTDVAVGSEAGAFHGLYAVVVQDWRYRHGRTVLVVPLTTNAAVPPSPWSVQVTRDDLNRLHADSIAMCWQLMAVDRTRITDLEGGRVQAWTLDVISKNIALLVGYPA